jgi:uncharacterized protein (DUF1684 family)
MRDDDGEVARSFAGFQWFPIDEKYRVKARFIKDPTQKKVNIPNQLGDDHQAYNPPCAFNPFTTCPLPPPENRLTVRILAGEKSYAGH